MPAPGARNRSPSASRGRASRNSTPRVRPRRREGAALRSAAMRARMDATSSRGTVRNAVLLGTFTLAALTALAAAATKTPVQPVYRAEREATVMDLACNAVAESHADTAHAGAA